MSTRLLLSRRKHDLLFTWGAFPAMRLHYPDTSTRGAAILLQNAIAGCQGCWKLQIAVADAYQFKKVTESVWQTVPSLDGLI